MRRVPEGTEGPRQSEAPATRVGWFLESERGKLSRTLETLLKAAKREARRKTCPSEQRLKWVNTICYITQTYNSILRDTDYDELRQKMTLLQEKMNKIADEKYQEPRKIITTSPKQGRESIGTEQPPGPS